METLLADLRHVVRVLVRHPIFSLVVAVSLSVGIATNVAVFSLANTLFVKSLPIPDADRWVNVYATSRGEGSFLVSYPEYLDILRESSFDEAVAHALITTGVRTRNVAVEVTSEVVSPNYFSTLGIRPYRGRGFNQTESAVVVVSHAFWRRQLAGDSTLGSRLVVNGQELTVVGVAPPDFAGTFAGLQVDLWMPSSEFDRIMPVSDTLLSRSSRRFDVTARLSPGVTADRAQVVMSALASHMVNSGVTSDRESGYLVVPASGIRPGVRGPLSVFVVILAAVVALVLVATCANVAGLMLIRVSERRREIAVMKALGASRVQIVRQLLAESLLLGLLGAGGALLLIVWLDAGMSQIQPNVGIPVALDLSPDARVLLFTILLSVLASVLIGLVPAVSGGTIHPDVRVGADVRLQSRFRSGLVVAQIGLAFALFIGTGLLFQSVRSALGLETGFDERMVWVGTVDLDQLRVSSSDGANLFSDMRQGVSGVPGAESVALARFVPLASQSDRFDVRYDDADDTQPTYYNVVTPGYFSTMGISLLRGRDFRDSDDASSDPVVIVNQTLANRLGPDPVGRTLHVSGRGHDGTVVSIVGVVADIKYRAMHEPALPYLYVPFGQNYRGLMTIHVRPQSNGTFSAMDLNRSVQSVVPRAVVVNSGPIRSMMRHIQVSQQVVGALLVVASTVAISLSLTGLYVMVGYLVRTRNREIGIRIAVGAKSTQIAAFVTKMGLGHLTIGLMVGTVLGLALSVVLSSVLLGVSRFDASVYVAALVALAVVYVAAVAAPAFRAIRVDPVVSLRSE